MVRAFYEGKNISGYQAYSNSGFSIISKDYIVDKDKKVIFEGTSQIRNLEVSLTIPIWKKN
ncbi:hypothetical protein EJ377_16985 [Chryseobacterium arthrosphaerae]|uniref:Uncharacterized protein n=1 Tax=Chryseobacterium arthrosphaerae TaxID=651561 RepID=A0A432DSN9_9FLAO|nr:hypothetical protein EJ377_16985 [Chryseobacterium arthrosphaerae]